MLWLEFLLTLFLQNLLTMFSQWRAVRAPSVDADADAADTDAAGDSSSVHAPASSSVPGPAAPASSLRSWRSVQAFAGSSQGGGTYVAAGEEESTDS